MNNVKSSLSTWKLISGILSILFHFIVVFQSCAAGFVSSVEEVNGAEESHSGLGGMFVAFLLFVGGIISISVKNSLGKGSHIALMVIFFLAAYVAYSSAEHYQDLYVWGFWSALNAVLAFVAMNKNSKKLAETTNKEEDTEGK